MVLRKHKTLLAQYNTGVPIKQSPTKKCISPGM